jgi:SAM-dependent methyltransferase
VLAKEFGLSAQFVCAEIQDLPPVLEGAFDIVYTSRGILGWLPDLGQWGQVIARCLRPGGFFYMSEVHPVAQVWDDEAPVGTLRLHYPYFEQPEPLILPVQGSYADRNAHVEQSVEYGWVHSLGEIITALAQAGLRIEFLHERPFQEWEMSFLEGHDDGTWWLPADAGGGLPLSFSLKATKR